MPLVLDGDPAPIPKKEAGPQFSAHFYCGQMAEWIKMALGMEVGPGPVHIVLDVDTAPLPKKGQSPQFSAHLYCGQTAGSIKMPHSMEVGLSPGDCVRWGPSPYPKRGGAPPNFWPTSIVAKRLHGSRCHLVVGMEVDLGLRDTVSDVDPATPRKKGTPTSIQFLAHVYCGQMAG